MGATTRGSMECLALCLQVVWWQDWCPLALLVVLACGSESWSMVVTKAWCPLPGRSVEGQVWIRLLQRGGPALPAGALPGSGC